MPQRPALILVVVGLLLPRHAPPKRSGPWLGVRWLRVWLIQDLEGRAQCKVWEVRVQSNTGSERENGSGWFRANQLYFCRGLDPFALFKNLHEIYCSLCNQAPKANVAELR